MACVTCGYTGTYQGKMDFNSDEAYNCLVSNGIVYTVRPWSTVTLKKVHLHRLGKAPGLVAVKKSIESGQGLDQLRLTMSKYVQLSGFNTIDDWVKTLLVMHGHVGKWTLFEVKLEAAPSELPYYLDKGHEEVLDSWKRIHRRRQLTPFPEVCSPGAGI